MGMLLCTRAGGERGGQVWPLSGGRRGLCVYVRASGALVLGFCGALGERPWHLGAPAPPARLVAQNIAQRICKRPPAPRQLALRDAQCAPGKGAGQQPRVGAPAGAAAPPCAAAIPAAAGQTTTVNRSFARLPVRPPRWRGAWGALESSQHAHWRHEPRAMPSRALPADAALHAGRRSTHEVMRRQGPRLAPRCRDPLPPLELPAQLPWQPESHECWLTCMQHRACESLWRGGGRSGSAVVSTWCVGQQGGRSRVGESGSRGDVAAQPAGPAGASVGSRSVQRRGGRRREESGGRAPHRCGRAWAAAAPRYVGACPCRRSATRMGCCSAVHEARREES